MTSHNGSHAQRASRPLPVGARHDGEKTVSDKITVSDTGKHATFDPNGVTGLVEEALFVTYYDDGYPRAMQLGDNPSPDVETGYAYQLGTGRLRKVTHEIPGGSGPEFTYDYLDNSHLLDTITGPQHTVSNSYEPHRNLRTRVSSDIDGDPQNNAFMLDYQYSYIPVKVAWAREIPSMNSISKSNLPLRAGKES